MLKIQSISLKLQYAEWKQSFLKSTSSIALIRVSARQVNFTSMPRFEIVKLRSFTEMNSQGSRVEKNTHAHGVYRSFAEQTYPGCQRLF